VRSRSFSSLSAGQSVSDTFSWNPTSGTHVFRFVVDVNNDLTETNENNNAATATVTP
jgi:subtilase family serine protease